MPVTDFQEMCRCNVLPPPQLDAIPDTVPVPKNTMKSKRQKKGKERKEKKAMAPICRSAVPPPVLLM
jgi:hypothetical protein